jgi:hypothetical protein
MRRTQMRLLASLVLLTGFGTAQAQEAGSSEFFFQAGAGQQFLTAHGGWLSGTARGEGQTEDIKTSGLNKTGARYQYGLNEMLALVGELSYSSLTIDLPGNDDKKSSGLEDVVVGLKGVNAMGMGNLRFGADLSYGLGNREQDGDFQSNRSSGGIALTPYVGYELAAGPGMLGARVSYRYNMERTVEGGGQTAKIEDGHVLGLAAFYEYMLADMIIGGRYSMDDAGDAKFEGQTFKSADTTALGVYTRIPMAGAAFLAGFDYTWTSNASDVGLDRDQNMVFNVGYRLGF